MIKELLPIGSVVTLRGGVKKLMIMGMKVAREDAPERYYDYMAVLYPEGYLGTKSTFLFDRTEINDVIFTGYNNPEREDLMNLLEAAMQQTVETAEQKPEDKPAEEAQ